MIDEKADIAVIGAGPAGLSAAIEAAKTGAKVVVYDENLKPGGQLFKQTHKFFGSKEHLAGVRGFNIGKLLLECASSNNVKIKLDTVVTGMYEPTTLELVSKGKKWKCETQAIIVATGAIENSLAFPGWTMPGVMGAGAAQTMININRVLPRKRILMVGSGNVGLIVSYQLKQAGAKVVAIIEAANKIGGYGVHSAKVMRAGIPIYLSTTIKEANGDPEVQGATIAKIDNQFKYIKGTEKSISVDTICIAVGLSPMTELLNMIGIEVTWDNRLGGHIPLHDENMMTSRPGIYVAGDVSGIEEASSAIEEGRLAGVAAAHKIGFINADEAETSKYQIRKRLDALRSGPFGEIRKAAKRDLIQLYKKMYYQNEAIQVQAAVVSIAGKTIENKVYLRGYPIIKEIKLSGNIPSEERLKKGPVAIIECVQEIPCNPCEKICPFGAIEIGTPITNLPLLDAEKCHGCGLCIPGCPGQAVFVVDFSKEAEYATVKIPWEFLPVPQKGDIVNAVDRKGKAIGKAVVSNVKYILKYDKTRVVELKVPRNIALDVRSMERGVKCE